MRQALMLLIASALAALFAVLPAQAQEKRVALVIGNSKYQNTQTLRNPVNDARAVAAALEKLNFDVVTGYDLDRDGFMKTVDAFRARAKGADVALLYYAGHGLQHNGQNFLVAVDAKLDTPAGLDQYTVRLNMVLDEMTAPTRLVFLDACRNYPLTKAALTNERSRSTLAGAFPKGLARVTTSAGTLIAFATQPNAVALDGDGPHSPFTGALLKYLATPDQDVGQMLRRVRKDVYEATSQRQTPWTDSSLLEDFYFRRVAHLDPARNPDHLARDGERTFWQSIKQSLNLEAFQTFLRRYPDSEYSDEARKMVETLQRDQNTALNTSREAPDQPARLASRSDDTTLSDQNANARPQNTLTLQDEDRQAEQPAVTPDTAQTPAQQTPAQQTPAEQTTATDEQPAENTPSVVEKQQPAPAPDQADQAKQEEVKVASRTEDLPVPEAQEKETLRTPEEMATELQKELKRVGCYLGAIDGDWGPRSKQALRDFVQEAHLKNKSLADSEPTADLIKRVRNYHDVCPPPAKREHIAKPPREKRPRVVHKPRPRYEPSPAPRHRPSPAPAPGPISIGVGLGGISF